MGYRNGNSEATFTAHSYYVDIAEFSPDSSALVIWSKTGALELWDVETCLPKITFTERVGEVTSIIFRPDGRMLASWNNNSIVIWDVETGKRKVKLAEDGMETVTSVHWSPDNRTLISISNDSNEPNTIRLWDVETGERKVISTEDGKQEVKPLFLSSDNSTFISSTRTNMFNTYYDDDSTCTFHLWDVETGKRKAILKTLVKRGGAVKSVFLSSDNRTLTTLTRGWKEEFTIHLWDVETGKCKATLAKDGIGKVKSIVWSSDNLTLISVSTSELSDFYRRSDEDTDDIIHLWDVETGTCRATFTEEIGNVKSVDLSPDGSTLILNQIYLWDVETGERKIDPIGNITCAALSPDGSIVASGNDKGTVLLWEISK